MDNIAKFLGFCIVFPIVYILITLNITHSVGHDTVQQLNYGIIIGILLYIATKKREI